LITELARVPNLRVVSRTSAMQEKGLHKPLQQIAQELRVDAVVEGSVVRAGDRVRITAQLIDTRDDRHLWAQSFEGPGSDVLALQDQVAREIASHAKLAMLPAESAAAKAVNPAAHDAYLRGKYFLDKRDARKSANYFEQAMAIDPGYALAYSGLAMALQSQTTLQLAAPDDVMPRAIAAAQRAIELDPSDGEAYVALGGIDTTYRWDWADAERNLLRGLELSPNDATAEFHYASYLDAMGRPEDAVTHMRRAVALDPLSFLMNRHLGSTLFFARHYDEALFYLRRAGEMEPARANVVENWISWVYLMKGMQAEAVRHDLASLPGGTAGPRAGQLQQIYAQQGWKAYWEERARGEESSTVPCASYDSAAIDLRLGQTDKAFAGMDKAIDRRCLWSIWLKVDPLADGLRGDKRYGALLARVKLPG
jgi:tetratricopeptide (TPR) repeat protein